MNIIEYANSFQSKSVLQLEPIAKLLNKIGNPQNHLKYIHVAGTNGKGSVCAFLQATLTHAGFKCGKFISPYVICQEERISIDRQNISTAAFNRLLQDLAQYADGQSPFELWTAAAFLYFYQQKCDIVVLECGMGGMGDATNIIPSSECAVITRIGLDHTDYLGSTIEEITHNKCGIIKPATKFVITPQQPTTPIIQTYAGARLRVAAETDYPLSLRGTHQKENAGIACAVCRALGIAESHIRYGLQHAKHPARFEVFACDPTVIYDGAHNPNGAAALVQNLPNEPLTLIFACMADKDIPGILKPFVAAGLNQTVQMRCTTVSNNPRAMQPAPLAKIATDMGFQAAPYPTIQAALANLKTTTCVFGSLYLYPEFLEAMQKNKL